MQFWRDLIPFTNITRLYPKPSLLQETDKLSETHEGTVSCHTLGRISSPPVHLKRVSPFNNHEERDATTYVHRTLMPSCLFINTPGLVKTHTSVIQSPHGACVRI